MSDNETMVGAVDGPSAMILAALERGEKLQSGTFLETLGLDPMEAVTMDHQGNRVIDRTTDAGRAVIAFQALLDSGRIHVSRGRGGGVKLGPKPPPSAKNATATALAILRKAR